MAAANHTQLVSSVSQNLSALNGPAIAATAAECEQMWAGM
jgi:PPE-repeat protein